MKQALIRAIKILIDKKEKPVYSDKIETLLDNNTTEKLYIPDYLEYREFQNILKGKK